MNSISYIVSNILGFNLILIVCCAAGILLAKKGGWAWVFYWIGVGLTAFSCFGNIRKYLYFFGTLPTIFLLELGSSIVIAIIAAVLINKQKNK